MRCRRSRSVRAHDRAVLKKKMMDTEGRYCEKRGDKARVVDLIEKWHKKAEKARDKRTELKSDAYAQSRIILNAEKHITQKRTTLLAIDADLNALEFESNDMELQMIEYDQDESLETFSNASLKSAPVV